MSTSASMPAQPSSPRGHARLSRRNFLAAAAVAAAAAGSVDVGNSSLATAKTTLTID